MNDSLIQYYFVKQITAKPIFDVDEWGLNIKRGCIKRSCFRKKKISV